jgi:hypothetical protein
MRGRAVGPGKYFHGGRIGRAIISICSMKLILREALRGMHRIFLSDVRHQETVQLLDVARCSA